MGRISKVGGMVGSCCSRQLTLAKKNWHPPNRHAGGCRYQHDEPTGDALLAVVELDLSELGAVQLPRGYDRV